LGGIILVGLVALLVVILIRPALIARYRALRKRSQAQRPDAVIEHIDDHRRR
jgi:hypothetical protein